VLHLAAVPILLRSELLDRAGFAHGFSLRTGGVSEPPFASLNLGRAVGDDPGAVAENHQRFREAVPFEPGRLFELSQVHGNAVLRVGPTDAVLAIRSLEGDALVSGVPGQCLGVRTADCVPVLVADPESGQVAAIHAGWRGCVRGVVDEALAAFEDPGRLVVAIGPHIRAGAFEVGEDVADELARVAPEVPVVARRSPRPYVDLSAVVRFRLATCGVPSASVDDVGGCTFSEPERFFSYRRDGKSSGRHLSVIVARP
jgi:hypothetical protein